MIKEKSPTRVFIWQFASKILIQGLGFITAPIFTRILSTDDYGKVAIYLTWVSFVTIFVGLETYGSIANAKMEYNEADIYRYISSILSISLFAFIATMGICLVFKDFFCKLLGVSFLILVVMLLQSFFSYCICMYTYKYIQYMQVEKSTALSFLVAFTSTLLSIVFVLRGRGSLSDARIIGNAIPNIIIGLLIFIFIYVKGKTFYNREYWRFCLILTVPLVFHSLSGIILNQFSRIMLQRMTNDSIVGVYSFASSLVMIISVIWTAFNTSWVPFYYEFKKEKKEEQILKRTHGYMVNFTIITIGFLMLSPEVFKLLAPVNYWQGLRLVPLMTLSYFFIFLYSFPANFEFYNGKTLFISIGTICASVINIILNIVLIPLYQDVGASLAMALSYVCLFIFHMYISKYIIKEFEYHIVDFAVPFFSVMIAVGVFYIAIDLFLVRWLVAIVVGCYFLLRLYKRRSLF